MGSVTLTGLLAGPGTVSLPITINSGGTISPGASPGTMTTANQTWKNGGAYLWEISDATGAAGANPGWDKLNIVGSLDLSLLTGTFTIDIASLTHSLSDVAGQADHFVSGSDYLWTIASASSGISGFNATKFAFDVTGWTGDLGGKTFQMQSDGNNLNLVIATGAVTTPVRTWLATALAPGNWSADGNWDYGAPTSTNPVVFNDKGTVLPLTTSGAAAQSLEFQTTGWTISGTQPLTVAGGSITDSATGGTNTITPQVIFSNNAQITVTGATHELKLVSAENLGILSLTKMGAGKLTTADLTAAAINVNEGSMNSGAVSATGAVTVGSAVAASLSAGNVTANAFNVVKGSATINSLTGTSAATSTATVAAGQMMNVALNVTKLKTLTVDGMATLHTAAVEGTAGETSIVGGLVMHPGLAGKPIGTLDIKAGNLVVDYTGGASPLYDVAGMLKSGANFVGGNLLWNGTGITSSTVAGSDNMLYGVGVRQAVDVGDYAMPDMTNVEGVALPSQSVVVKYTWQGDADLNGVVNVDDYAVIDYYALFTPDPSVAGWWTGDFNGDGLVNVDDYALIDYAALFQDGSTLGNANGLGAVPEPATMALLALGMAAMAMRRRRAGR
jgi:hypothetical protein